MSYSNVRDKRSSMQLAQRAFTNSAYLPKRAPDIKTRYELQRREAQRAAPLPVLELTPPSVRIQAMKQKTDQQNEQRIKLLRERLEAARRKIASDHHKALAKGKSKAAFNRER